jgi:flagellar hook-length control protein FliK
MNAPAARPFAGEGSPAPKVDRADRDDLFARMLDEERVAREVEKGSDIVSPATAPAPALVETPARPEPVEASNEVATPEPASDDQTATATDQRSDLNSLNSEAANAATTGDGGAEGSANGDAASAKPLAATPTDGALLILANASGASGAPATNTDEPDASGETGTTSEASPEGAGILALAGIAQPAVAQAAASGESATAKPATIDAAGAPPIPTDMAEDAGANPAAGKDGKQSDAAKPQSANPAAASQANSPAAASATTQANAAAAAASATDGAAQPASNAGNAATQAAAQPASTANPLTDATRAVATPPALQSAPAATIQVYSRIIERADGRVQRFEVRLDPAELGRVDIRIEIGADRKVHAVMAAHDSAALTDLMRGQKALERALSEAGIDLADQGLKFEMSSDAGRGSASQQRDSDGRTSQPDAWRKFDTASIPVSTEAAAVATPTRRTQRLDLVA